MVRAYLVPNRSVESVIGCGVGSPFLGQGSLLGFSSFPLVKGPVLVPHHIFDHLGFTTAGVLLLVISSFDLASWRQVLGLFLIHWTHPF